MGRYSYKIGTSVATLKNVEDLTTGVPNVAPRGMAVDPVSVRRVGADGRTYGDGYPTTKWEFDIINGKQLDAILAYLTAGQESGVVYIATRLTDRTYKNYKAVMHRPIINEDMSPAYVERFKDVTIRFTMLELVS